MMLCCKHVHVNIRAYALRIISDIMFLILKDNSLCYKVYLAQW